MATDLWSEEELEGFTCAVVIDIGSVQFSDTF
jgi:hypothetical protein